MSAALDCDVTFVIRTRDDEERVGHVLQRIAGWLRAQKLRSEILVADEGSGDNTVAVAVMLRPTIRELEVLHAAPGEGFRDACARARGRLLVLADARTEAPLAPLGYALGRLVDGRDVVALAGRYLVMRRTRAWRAFDALVHTQRGLDTIEARFLRRARALGLACAATRRHPLQCIRFLYALRPAVPMRLALRDVS
jgi:hypothetical protein